MSWPQFVKIIDGVPQIEIGAMRHQIGIQVQAPTSPPTFGAAGPMLVWTTLFSADAAIEIVRGVDVIKGGQTTAQLYLTIAMWFQDGVLPNMQVAHENGSIYIVRSVENVHEMGVVLLLNCIGLNSNV